MKPAEMEGLSLIDKSRFGRGDGRAINRHSMETYEDGSGRRYTLDRCLDASPPYFEAYGPFLPPKGNECLFPPRLIVPGLDSSGDGLSWGKARKMFHDAVKAHFQPKGGI